MGHQEAIKKVQAIEFIDERWFRLWRTFGSRRGVPYACTPDHPTLVRLRTHTSDSVPYMLYDSSAPLNKTWDYTEEAATASGNVVAKGCEMIDILFAK